MGNQLKDVTNETLPPIGRPDPGRAWYTRVPGWAIAAIAVGQGTPSWYDVPCRARKLWNS